MAATTPTMDVVAVCTGKHQALHHPNLHGWSNSEWCLSTTTFCSLSRPLYARFLIHVELERRDSQQFDICMHPTSSALCVFCFLLGSLAGLASQPDIHPSAKDLPAYLSLQLLSVFQCLSRPPLHLACTYQESEFFSLLLLLLLELFFVACWVVSSHSSSHYVRDVFRAVFPALSSSLMVCCLNVYLFVSLACLFHPAVPS
mmetsp:Transcript_93698/g.205084  ORF Transcript_93698/g.205084 Transcript_93698/m.205084 type:complete len:201 (-) Transcript_93698:128-730(-)